MSEIFNLDNGFFRFMGKTVDAVIASVLWMVCCIPVVTIGASTTAFYYTVHKSLRKDEGYISKEFFHAFVENFKQSTICWLIMLVIGAFLSMDAYVTYQLKEQQDAVGNIFYVIVTLLVLLGIEFIYIFPYISRFEDNIKMTFKNACFMAFGRPLRLVAILVSTLIAGYILYVVPYLAFIVPAIYMLAVEQMMERNYAKYMPEEEIYDEDGEKVEKPVDGKHMSFWAVKKMKAEKNK